MSDCGYNTEAAIATFKSAAQEGRDSAYDSLARITNEANENLDNPEYQKFLDDLRADSSANEYLTDLALVNTQDNFDAIDTDNDGLIERTELQAIVNSNNASEADQLLAQTVLDNFDSLAAMEEDCEGGITKEDLVTASDDPTVLEHLGQFFGGIADSVTNSVNGFVDNRQALVNLGLDTAQMVGNYIVDGVQGQNGEDESTATDSSAPAVETSSSPQDYGTETGEDTPATDAAEVSALTDAQIEHAQYVEASQDSNGEDSDAEDVELDSTDLEAQQREQEIEELRRAYEEMRALAVVESGGSYWSIAAQLLVASGLSTTESNFNQLTADLTAALQAANNNMPLHPGNQLSLGSPADPNSPFSLVRSVAQPVVESETSESGSNGGGAHTGEQVVME